MAQGGILGNGCKVAYSATSPVTWVGVDNVIDITFPTYVADDINIDTHSVTNNLHKIMPGMISVGAPGFTVLSDMDPSTSPDQAQLRSWNRSGTSVWFRIEVPVNRAKTSFFGIEFEASVKSVEPATPIADKQTTRYNLSFDGDDIYDDVAAGASEIS